MNLFPYPSIYLFSVYSLAITQYDTDLARRTVALLYDWLNVMMTECSLDGYQYHKVLYVVLAE